MGNGWDRAIVRVIEAILTRSLDVRRYSLVRGGVRALARLSRTDPSEVVLRRVEARYDAQFDVPHSARAQKELLQISTIFPDRSILFSKLLRIYTYRDGGGELERFVSRTASHHLLSRTDVRLLLLFERIKAERFDGAVTDLLTIRYGAIEHDLILRDVWRIASIHMIIKNDSAYFAAFQPAHFVKLVEIEPQPGAIYDLLPNLLYKPISRVHYGETIDLLSRLSLEHAPECFAVVYHFLMTCGHVEQGHRLERLNAGALQGALHPLYVRSRLGPLGIRDAPRSIAAADLAKSADDETALLWRNAELQRREIRERIRKAAQSARPPGAHGGTDRPHILIAVFGQMRFPTVTLPGIRDWLQGNFRPEDGGCKLSYGVATWRATGSKVIELGYGFEYVLPYFPPSLAEPLRGMGLARVADTRSHFPRFSRKLFDILSQTTDVVVEAQIEDLLGSKVYFDISEDEIYMDQLGRFIADFAPNHRHMLNQGRMIDRIGAMAGIMRRIEAEHRPITHVLFLRPDLYNLSGTLRDHLDSFTDRHNWAILDEDHLAQLTDGVGDRYILADRAAALHIIETRNRIGRLFQERPRDDLFCSRITPHQMLGTVLFENSVEVRTLATSELGWEFYRGNLTWQDFIDNLRADIDNLADAELRRKLSSAMPPAHRG